MKNSKTNERTTFGGVNMDETLKQKAEEYTKKYINHKMAIHDIFDLEVVQKDVTRLLVDFATEATKELKEQNKELTLKISGLESDCDAYNYSQQTYQEEITELEAQIEKMKCCYNCKHSRTEYEHCRTDKHEKWEIKEK